MKKRKYDYLLQDYPNYLTKEDFYKLAHISKSTALYLLQSGKVPCKDTGHKTHRYLIPTENVIHYLEDREIHPNEYAAEPGWYSGKVKHGKKKRLSKKRKQKVNAARNKLKELTDAKLEELEDLLDINDICRLTGFSSTSVLRWCRSGKLEAFMVSGKYLIPKVCFKEYLATKCGTANINKEENIMFNNLKENNQQSNMRSGQSLPTDITDEEMDRRINESVIGRYGYGGMIPIVPLDRTIDDAYRGATIDMIKDGEIPLNYDTISSLHLTADKIKELQSTPEEEKLSPKKINEIKERLRKRDRELYEFQSVATLHEMSKDSVFVKYAGEDETPPIYFTNTPLDEQYKDLAIDMMVQGNMPTSYETITTFKLSPSEIRKVIKGNNLPNEVPQIPDKSTYIVPEAIAEKLASQSPVEKSANPYLDAEEDRTVSPGSLRKTVSPFDLADELMRNSVIKGFNGYIAIYLPEKGYYQIQDSVSLRNFIYQKLRPTIQTAGSVSLVDAVAKAVEYEVSDNDGQVCNDYLAFQDGLLNLRTEYLEPYSPECFMTYRIEANFRQGAHTPTPYSIKCYI